MTQRETNPFPYSDSNKRYYTFDYYIKKTYGVKCAKIPVDAGFTCPNIDGSKGRGGCIYCSPRGSGDFAACGSISEQLESGLFAIRKKWKDCAAIAYFQAHTNTYAPLEMLKQKFGEAAAFEHTKAISIATRADCLPEETCEYLNDLAQRIDLTVELGLQTANEKTAKLINRCMTLSEFEEGYMRLRKYPKIRICVHIINGLPGEDESTMLNTARYVGSISADAVKIHMLYVMKNTALDRMYAEGGITLLTEEEFIRITVNQLCLLPKETVIERLTGDAPGNELTAPEWTRKKVCVINGIDKMMYEKNLFQGIYV